MIALILVAALAQAAPAVSGNRVPSDAVIRDLESKAVLPSGAAPLGAYTRYYTEANLDGHPTIIGQMIDTRVVEEILKSSNKPTPPKVVRGFAADLPGGFDGSCAILNVMFTDGSASSPRIVCNAPGPGPRK